MAGESTTSSRWGTARAFVGRYFARVLIAVSQIPTWFIPLIEGKKVGDLSIGNWVIPPLRDSSATAVLIGLAIVVLVIGGIAELLRDRKNKQHAVDLSHMQDAFASALHVHDALDAATREALWGFTDEIGVTREGTSLLPDRARCRITLYIHHESDNLFTPIHRLSTDPKLDGFRRASYPDDQGFIAEVWEKNWRQVENLRANEGAWVAQMEAKYKIPEATARHIRMKSRSLVGFCLQENKQKVGIVILESDHPSGLPETLIDISQDSKSIRVLNTLTPLLREKYIHDQRTQPSIETCAHRSSEPGEPLRAQTDCTGGHGPVASRVRSGG